MATKASRRLLSVCIVNWNTRDLLRACLLSLRKHPPSSRLMEIIMVDNASRDGSAEMVVAEFPGVRLVRNPRNLNYARGSNQAIALASGDLIMLLNPDTEVFDGTLDRLCRFVDEHPEAGAAGCLLVSPDGSVQSSCRSLPTPPVLLFEMLRLAGLPFRPPQDWRYYVDLPQSGYREVDQPMASALCLRRRALDQVGVFDERFPLFWNDVDLCYLLKRAGWSIYAVCDCRVLHHLGASTRQAAARAVVDSHRGLIRFYLKHYVSRYGWLLAGLCIAAIWLAGWARLGMRLLLDPTLLWRAH